MLDWLKEILKDNYSDEIDKAVSEKISKNFVSKSDFNSQKTANSTLTQQIADRDKQLEELKKIDAAGMQAQISKLQDDNKKAKKDYEKAIAGMKLDAAIERGVLSARGKNATAIKSLLDREKIKFNDEGKVEGLDDEIKRIQTSDPYLFEKIEHSQEGTESNGGESGGSGAGDSEEPPEDYDSYVKWREKH